MEGEVEWLVEGLRDADGEELGLVETEIDGEKEQASMRKSRGRQRENLHQDPTRKEAAEQHRGSQEACS